LYSPSLPSSLLDELLLSDSDDDDGSRVLLGFRVADEDSEDEDSEPVAGWTASSPLVGDSFAASSEGFFDGRTVGLGDGLGSVEVLLELLELLTPLSWSTTRCGVWTGSEVWTAAATAVTAAPSTRAEASEAATT